MPDKARVMWFNECLHLVVLTHLFNKNYSTYSLEDEEVRQWTKVSET